MLLKTSSACLNSANNGGRTALHVSAYRQHVACVVVLLKYNCDVNIQVKCHISVYFISFSNESVDLYDEVKKQTT
jgi:ankyrin repeat protein